VHLVGLDERMVVRNPVDGRRRDVYDSCTTDRVRHLEDRARAVDVDLVDLVAEELGG